MRRSPRPFSCAHKERTFLFFFFKWVSSGNAEARAPSAVHAWERWEAAEAELHAGAGRGAIGEREVWC